MAQSKYENVRQFIAGVVCKSDFEKIDAAMKPQPTPTETIDFTVTGATVAVSATVSVVPTNVTPSGVEFAYTSSDIEKATVTNEGVVSGLAAGEVAITVVGSKTGLDSVTKTCTVTVTE